MKTRLSLLAVSIGIVVTIFANSFPQWAAPIQVQQPIEKQTIKPGFEFRLQNVRKITPDANFKNPVWSPVDPDTLVFISTESPGTYVFSLSNDRMGKVTDEVAGFKFFWSQDGRSVVYRTRIDKETMAIKQIEIETGGVYTLTQSKDLSLPQEIKDGLIRYK